MATKPVTLANPAANRAAVAAGKDPFAPAPEQEDVNVETEVTEDEVTEEVTEEAPAEETEEDSANREAVKQAFYAEIQKLGRQQGQGIASLMSLAEKMVKAGTDKTIEPADIKEVYKRFRAASNNAAGKNAEGGLDEHSITSNTGKLKLFYNVGANYEYDGWDDMLVRARDLHVAALRGGDKARDMLKITATYEALVMVAREQLRTQGKGEEKVWLHPNLLTDDEIKEVIMPEGHTKEKTVLDMIDEAIKAVERTAAGKDGVRDAIEIDEPEDGSVGSSLKNAIDHLKYAGDLIDEKFSENRAKKMAEAAAAEAKREEERAARMAKKEEKRLADEKEKQEKLAAAAAKKAAAKKPTAKPAPVQAAAAK